MNNPIGITSWSMPSPNTHTLALAAQLGFDAVQPELGDYDRTMTYTLARFRELTLEESRRLGLKLLPMTLNALGGHGFVGGPDSADWSIAMEIIDAGLNAAAAMGLEAVAVPSFGSNMIRTPTHLDATAQALRYACGEAGRRGLLVYTENVLVKDELDRLFAAVDSPQLRLLFDSQNYTVFGRGGAMEVLRAYTDRLGSYVHVKDGVNGVGDLPLGQGLSPLTGMMQVLRETGFAGTIVLENNYNEPPFCRPAQGDVFDAIRRDVEMLRAL